MPYPADISSCCSILIVDTLTAGMCLAPMGCSIHTTSVDNISRYVSQGRTFFLPMLSLTDSISLISHAHFRSWHVNRRSMARQDRIIQLVHLINNDVLDTADSGMFFTLFPPSLEEISSDSSIDSKAISTWRCASVSHNCWHMPVSEERTNLLIV